MPRTRTRSLAPSYRRSLWSRRERSRRMRALSSASVTLAFAASIFCGTAFGGYGCPRLEAGLPQVYLYMKGEKLQWTTDGRGHRWDPDPRQCDEHLFTLPKPSAKTVARWRPELVTEAEVTGAAIDPDSEPLSYAPAGCVKVGTDVFFGLYVYHGEGSRFLGGIGRYDTVKGTFEFKHRGELAALSVMAMVPDRDFYWIGTESDGEGTAEPGIPLSRYRWSDNSLTILSEQTGAPCALRLHGLARSGNSLWVASDLGLAITELPRLHWHYYVPSADGKSLVETTCEQVIQKAVRSLPDKFQSETDGACDLDGSTPRDQFVNLVRRYRPDLTKFLLLKK